MAGSLQSKYDILKEAIDVTKAYASSASASHAHIAFVLESVYKKIVELKKDAGN